MRFSIIALALMLGTGVAAAAEPGQAWIDAFKAGKSRDAAKVTVKENLKYGEAGKDSTVAKQIDRFYGKLFRKLRKEFSDANLEANASCTDAARELGYMAGEWKDKDESLASWIRDIPDKVCDGMGEHPPTFFMLKKLGGEFPHALIVVQQGEDPSVVAFYHF